MPSRLADTHRPSPGPIRDASSSGRFRWCFAPAAPALQQAIREIPWDCLESFPAASRVKVAENRDVYRIDLPAGVIYAKCYRAQGLVKQLVERLRGPAARREWLALRRAADIGLQAPQALAYATAATAKPDRYSALLITAAMAPGARSLDEAWLAAASQPDPPVARRHKCRLIEALAELLSRAHAGGLFHRDLHVGNILIFPHNGSVTAAMIDLHNARLCKGLALSGLHRNLVQLNQWFARHASRTDRLRFLKIYCRCLQPRIGRAAGQGYDHKVFARHVLKVSHSYAARLYAKRDRRILKRNKYFTTLALSGGWSARLALEIKHGRPYDHPLDHLPDKKGWRDLLADLDVLLAGDAVRVLKNSSTRRVLQADVPFAGRAWTLIAKHEQGKGVLSWLLARLGRDPLQREFLTGWQCLHRDLPVALPLGLLIRQTPSRSESILLVEYLTDSCDLDTFARLRLPELPPDQARSLKRLVCRQLAQTLRRMWTCRLAHRDLKAANVRLQIPQGNLDAVKIVLVDVDGIRTVRFSLRKALLRSLARLDASFASSAAVTRTDRLRLLLAVLRGIDSPQPDWKDAWQQIRAMSLRDQATIAKTLPWLQPIVGSAGAE